MNQYSRRAFFKTASAASALPLAGISATVAGAAAAAAAAAAPALPGGARLQWLEATAPALSTGTTWGLPWPRGQARPGQLFALKNGQGQALPLQSWPLAFWPDGSLKWTAHALPAGVPLSEQLSIEPTAQATAPASPLRITESREAISVDTGVMQCVIARKGSQPIRSIHREGREILRAGTLVAVADDKPDASTGAVTQTQFDSEIRKATVEQNGPVRAVIKIEGLHRAGERRWLPFVLRLYFHAGAESLRVMHSFIYDGDENKDFLRGIALRFDVPLRDALHDRHVRFAGENGANGPGLWAEAVRNLTGLRRDPGAAVRAAQFDGRALPAAGRVRHPGAHADTPHPGLGRLHAQPGRGRCLPDQETHPGPATAGSMRPGATERRARAISAVPPAAWSSACATSGSGIRRSWTSATATRMQRR